MSNAIQLQADVGGLGIRGLGAFSGVLSTLSADNVTPMAMVQMENLGALFHVNGQFAEQVPDKLKRFSLQPLGRLAVSVGWRRGDSASLMADSSGGQAVALLSLCLTNLYLKGTVALILHRICSRVLSKNINVASIAQLGEVANILSGKLQTLGFGNFLAQQAVKVHSVYEQLGVKLPGDLLRTLTEEAMVDLLECLKRIFSEDNAVLRVTGVTGMGYVLAMVLFMFPNDTLVTAESFVLHEGSSTKKRIIVELSQAVNGHLQSRVETELKTEPVVELPICSVNMLDQCYFTWHGWMARYLQLTFSEFGVICSEELRIATCDLLIAVAPEFGRKSSKKKKFGSLSCGLEAMLGEYPMHRMERICEDILLVRPSAIRITVLSAFAKLASIFSDLTKDLSCQCHVLCDFKSGWRDRNDKFSKNCPRRILWECYAGSLDHGLLSFVVNSGPDVATFSRWRVSKKEVAKLVDTALGNIPISRFFTSRELNYYIHHSFVGYYPGQLAGGQGSTLLAAALKSFRIPSSLLRTFDLVDGQLVYNGRYHKSLCCDQFNESRPRAARSIVSRPKLVEPSSIGQHSRLSLTIFEDILGLKMKTTAQYAGMNLHFGLSSILDGYFTLVATDKCPHPSSSPLKKTLNQRIMITSVASPRPEGSKIGLVMTQSNPTAQFLSCHKEVDALLLRDCCLDCAFQQAKEGGFHTIIVT